MIDLLALELEPAIVGRPIQRHDLDLALEQRDERGEQLPVEPVGIELVGGHVGGRDHHHAAGEQLLEQPPQQHGVGDVGDLELVEAEQARALEHRLDHRGNRIGVVRLGPRRLAEPGDRRMHLVHELVEVHAALFRDRDLREEQVHQERLAAPHLAHQVGALDGFGLFQQPGEKAARRLAGTQFRRDAVEGPGGPLLQRVGAERALLHQGGERRAHRMGCGPPPRASHSYPTIEMPWPPARVPMNRLPERISAAIMSPFSSNSCTWVPASCHEATTLRPGNWQPGVEAR